MLQEELNDKYLEDLRFHLNELKFRDGVLISAELGKGNQGTNYVLRKLPDKKQRWLKWLFTPKIVVDKRYMAGFKDLSHRKELAINNAANAVAQSAEHVLSFFMMLKTELAFYVGCLNLYDRLMENGGLITFPIPLNRHERGHSFAGLYDASLSLVLKRQVVGNTIDANEKNFVIITGANQGGKSTFLRSIGQAQIMMQCGMYVAAKSFCANICDGVFTHFKREEDSTMKSGKLDEELSRMSTIVEQLGADSLMLFNESFSATNEREGSEIGRQIVRALLERHVKVFFVSHLYDFSSSFYEKKTGDALFLRAQRRSDGSRTFRLIYGKPMPTSYGEDLYRKVFGEDINGDNVSIE